MINTFSFFVVKELSALQNKHLNLPTMDDSIDEEHAIEIQTQETTQVSYSCLERF